MLACVQPPAGRERPAVHRLKECVMNSVQFDSLALYKERTSQVRLN